MHETGSFRLEGPGPVLHESALESALTGVPGALAEILRLAADAALAAELRLLGHQPAQTHLNVALGSARQSRRVLTCLNWSQEGPIIDTGCLLARLSDEKRLHCRTGLD